MRNGGLPSRESLPMMQANGSAIVRPRESLMACSSASAFADKLVAAVIDASDAALSEFKKDLLSILVPRSELLRFQASILTDI
jgi:hypothetical protein